MLKFLIIPYLILELLITANFVDSNGFLTYVAEVLLSMVLGVAIVGLSTTQNAKDIRRITLNSIFGGFGYVIGGVLFMVPGILSDILAVAVLAMSFLIKNFNLFGRNTQNYTQNNTQNSAQNNRDFKGKTYDDSEIIDVEVIEEEKK